MTDDGAHLDVVTVGCLVMSVLGLFSLFVSSKPVTFAGVVMTLFLSMSVTQAAMGISRFMSSGNGVSSYGGTPGVDDDVFGHRQHQHQHQHHHHTDNHHAHPDVVDQARVLWAWVYGTVVSSN